MTFYIIYQLSKQKFVSLKGGGSSHILIRISGVSMDCDSLCRSSAFQWIHHTNTKCPRCEARGTEQDYHFDYL